MEEIIVDNRKVKCYQITEKGIDLYKKMSTFFNTHEKLFQELHTKLKMGVRANEKIVLLPTTQS